MTEPLPNILIVDDKPANLKALRALLGGLEANILEATSGNDALGLAVEHDLALMLLDVDMPGMDGYEVANMARGLEQTRNVPILFITAAFRDDLHRLKGFRAGAVDYIEKPIHDEILAAKVRVFLDLYVANQRLRESNRSLREEVARREQAEERLRLLSRAVEASPASIVITDDKGTIQYVNPKFEQVTGYRAEEAIGRNPRILKSGKTEVHAYKQLWDAITHGREWHGEFCNRRKDGSLYWEFASINPVRDETGTGISHYVAVKEDITDRKEAIQQLEEARRLADAASRAKSDFLATMSHEIRTPMNAILGMAELLEETGLTSEQRDYLRVCRSSGENLLQIIDDILDISRVEAGQMKLHNISFNPRLIAREAGEVIRFRAQGKGLSQIVFVDGMVPVWCMGDPARIRQILINFLGNAVKFTDQGCIALLVSARPLDGAGQTVTFRVVDTGIGISEEHQKAIFEPFQQVDASSTRRHGGTGLGLAICQRLARLMDGTVEVRSRVGQGSVFSLSVPLADGVAPEPSAPSERSLAGRHVLVKHNHPIGGLYIEEMLQELGVLVRSCGTERVLEACFRQEKPERSVDALIIHHHREDLVDIAADLAGLKHSPAGTRLPVLVCGRCDDRDLPRLLKGFGAAFLPEPMDRDALARELERLISPSTAPADGPAPAEAPTVALRILLAEDAEENAMIIESYLAGTPHHLDIAVNGVQAVAMFQEDHYDLVLMDMQMPVLNGYEATQRIRAWERKQRRRPCPILALTAYAMSGDTEKSLAAGCDGHLTKPIRKITLLKTIRDITRS